MTIDFDTSRWDQLRETHKRWWAGELNRPIVPVELSGRDPGRPEPDTPLLDQANCHDLQIPAEDLVDRMDYELATKVFLGDAYPWISLDAFGPGVIAAMLGARLENHSGQVWFVPEEEKPITDIHFEFDPNNVWFERIREIYIAAVKRWQGEVLLGMPDIGGNLDILSVFRPGEQLLLDLYDHPDEVKRLLWEAHNCWHRVYEELDSILQPTNQGYTDWSGLYTDRPCYMLQCDFSYMIGTDMFNEFARPELEATCAKFPYSFYHLDGPGELPHLESLIEIENLNGIQWVPGAGRPDCSHWPEVYQKIHEAGKKIQLIGCDFDILDTVIDQLGTGKSIHELIIRKPIEEEDDVLRRLAKYGIE